ncbi:MAG: tripartite tricarboxylate transporter TctB family protein [Halomonas sp.]
MLSTLILGVVTLLSAIFFFLQTTDLPERSALFTQLILWGLGVAGALLVFQAFIERRQATVNGVRETQRKERHQLASILFFQVLIPGSLMLMAYLILLAVGFYPASAFLVFTVYCYHNYRINSTKLKPRTLVRSAMFALIITVFMYLVFTLLLGLPAPSGNFF